jgi:hypothetical protein
MIFIVLRSTFMAVRAHFSLIYLNFYKNVLKNIKICPIFVIDFTNQLLYKSSRTFKPSC